MSELTITFLEKIFNRLRSGKALVAPSHEVDIAIWFARKGFQVTAYDNNQSNISKLNERAKAEQAKVSAEIKDLSLTILPLMAFDTIVLTGEKPASRFFSEINRSLANGGTVFVEGYSIEEAVKHSEKIDARGCYRPNELIAFLKELHILYYSEEKIENSFLVRCLARKPINKDMIKYGFTEKRPGEENKSAAVLAAEKLFKK